MIDLSEKKIALFGGTFNPIHIGHILTGNDLVENYGYDYVIYIPDNIPAHKELSCSTKPYHRLKMIKLAVKNNKKFLYSDIEIKRGGISYTIDTIRELKNKYKVLNKIGVVIGDDLIDTLKTWKDIDSLQNECDILCLTRNTAKDITSKYNFKKIKNRMIDISSTEIRDRIKKGLTIDCMVNEEVKNYIYKKKLYK